MTPQTDTTTTPPTTDPQAPQGAAFQRAGNLMIGPDTSKPGGPSPIQARVAELRQMIANGQNPLEVAATAPASAPQPAEPAAAEPEHAEPEHAETATLPDGFRRLDGGQIIGPDGRFWSQQQVAEYVAEQAGEPADSAVEPTAEPEAEPARQPIRVSIPGRRPDDPDKEWEIDDPELAEDINRLRNGYMRREQLHRERADVQRAQEEIAEVREQIRIDPVSFILDEVQPDVRADLVRHLLADDEVYNAVIEEIAAWDNDPAERRARAAELRADRYRRRDEVAAQLARTRAARRNAVEVRDAVHALIPDDWDAQRIANFHRYAIRELTEYVNQNRIEHLPPDDVPVLLERLGVLQLFGVPYAPAAPGAAEPAPPTTGGANPAAVMSPAPARQPAARPATPGPAVTPQTAAPAQAVGERFRAAHARRAAASAVAPAGLGATPARPTKPAGLGVKESIEWARQHMRR